MVNFKENNHFQSSRGGPFSGGSTCLFPIETHITFDFPGGGEDSYKNEGMNLLPTQKWIHGKATHFFNVDVMWSNVDLYIINMDTLSTTLICKCE